MLPVAVARFSSDDKAMCYYVGLLPALWMTSCFHTTNGPESKTMRMFRLVDDDN